MPEKNDIEYKKFCQISHEELYEELKKIKTHLCWLEEQVSLTKDQWNIFISIKTTLKNLFVCK